MTLFVTAGYKVSFALPPEGDHLVPYFVRALGGGLDGGCCIGYYVARQLNLCEGELSVYRVRGPLLGPVQFSFLPLAMHCLSSACPWDYIWVDIVPHGHSRPSSSRELTFPWSMEVASSPVLGRGLLKAVCNFHQVLPESSHGLPPLVLEPILIQDQGQVSLFQARNIRIGRSGAEAGEGFPYALPFCLQACIVPSCPYGPDLLSEQGVVQTLVLTLTSFRTCYIRFSCWSLTCTSVAQGCGPALVASAVWIFFVRRRLPQPYLSFLCTPFVTSVFGAYSHPLSAVQSKPRVPWEGSCSCLQPAFRIACFYLLPVLHLAKTSATFIGNGRCHKDRDKKRGKNSSRTGRPTRMPLRRGFLSIGLVVDGFLVGCLLLPSLPCQVWAMPKPWGEAVDIILTAVRLFPRALACIRRQSLGF